MSIEKLSVEYPEIVEDERLRDESVALHAIEHVQGSSVELGHGNVAEVITYREHDVDVCVKAFHRYLGPENTPYNSARGEMKMMETAWKAGVRVPKPYFVAEAYNPASENDPQEPLTLKYIAMEKINGLSLADMMVKKVPLPEGFDLENFMSSLSRQLKRLHEENIYHRDLHYGNVMLEFETGDPVIIDWGQAKVSFVAEDSPYDDEGVRPSGTPPYVDDDKALDTIRKQIEMHLVPLTKI